MLWVQRILNFKAKKLFDFFHVHKFIISIIKLRMIYYYIKLKIVLLSNVN